MYRLLFLLLLCCCHSAWAQSDDSALITRNGVSVNTADIDSFLLTIPEEDRATFSSSKQRIIETIDTILLNKTLFRDAQENGVADDPEVKAIIEKGKQRVIVEKWLENYVEKQPEADFDAIAQEYYLLNKAQFASPESISIKHILISSKVRPADKAHDIASAVYSRIKSGNTTFDQAVVEYSDDTATKNIAGLIENIVAGQTDPAFEAAAFSLNFATPLSEVVDSEFGSHIIQFVSENDSVPLSYEEVEASLLEQAKVQHRQRVVEAYIESIKTSDVNVNEELVAQYLEKLTRSGL